MPDDQKSIGKMTRREALPGAAGLAALVVPRHVLGGPGYQAPSDKLNIGGVGIGGNIARSHLGGMMAAAGGENIVALCDVDESYSVPTYKLWPDARRYTDFREMFDKEEKNLDAVYIATPDHNHAIIAMRALKMGKHVMCVKPLARTVHENRVLARAAKQSGVVTQVTASSRVTSGAIRLCEMIWDGAIGPVHEVHAWTNRPLWPQGVPRPEETPPVPQDFDWNLWLGPARPRPYHPAYHPWIWRGWWDFGTGSLGDMGCHFFNTMFRALKLGQPTSVQAVSTTHALRPEFDYPTGRKKLRWAEYSETAPASAILTWDFPARENMPPVRVRWYDGGMKPPVPEELGPGATLGDNGILYVGSKGKILGGTNDGQIIPEEKARRYGDPPETVEGLPFDDKHMLQSEFLAACKGGKLVPSCNFSVAAHLTEVALLGNIATRTGLHLEWDGQSRRFKNAPEANALLDEEYHGGWTLEG